MNYVYNPSEVEITFGLPIPLPGILEEPFSVSDFHNVNIMPAVKCSTKTGIFGEPSINMKRTNKAIIEIETSHGSDDNIKLFALNEIQSYGIIGLPMFINHIVENKDDIRPRPYFSCPVSILQGLPRYGMGKRSQNRIFTFEISHLTTIYK